MKREAILFSFLLIMLSYSCYAIGSNNATITFEANIFSSSSNNANMTISNETIISIEAIPNYIFFGNLTAGQMSNEFKVVVNNTGNVDVTVTPLLGDSAEKIFNYTYFRSTKTHNGIAVPFTRIGDYNFNVSKSDNEYFYTSLDLTNYFEDIPQDMIGHKAEIILWAMPK